MAPYDVHCIERMTSLPMVKSAIGMATDGYGRIKSSSALVGGTLSRAEQSLSYVAETAKPMVNMFEKPISMADSLVCQGLDKLEEKVPVIKKSTEEVKDAGLQTYEGWKKYGTDKVSEMKDYGASKVTENAVAKALLSSIDSAVKLTETTVDHYLPPSQEEPRDNPKTDDMNVVRRVSLVSDKMRRRMYSKVMDKVSELPAAKSVVALGPRVAAMEAISAFWSFLLTTLNVGPPGATVEERRKSVEEGMLVVYSAMWHSMPELMQKWLAEKLPVLAPKPLEKTA